ncbi:MAG: hypothetical protein WCV68_00115 [Candidatus Paceibacterota bacterium]
MKKATLIWVLAAMMSISAWAGGYTDAERVADAFASVDVNQYEGQFGFTRLLPNGTSSDVRGDFSLDANGKIPRLVIDGVSVVNWGDEPLGGLPVNKLGSATNYWLRLDGWDGKAGRFAIYGWFSTVLLEPKDRITVELNLAYVEAFVAFDAADYDSSRLVLRYSNGESGYDTSRGGFVLWIDPAASDVSYDIVDTGISQVVASGTLQSGVAEDNVINKFMPAGVRELFPVGQDFVSLHDQWFGSSILRNEAWVPAQIYIARAYGSALTLEPSGTAVGRVEVYAVDDDRNRTLVSELDIPVPVSVGKGGGVETRPILNVPAGYENLVIELIGAPDNWGSFGIVAYKAQQGGRG